MGQAALFLAAQRFFYAAAIFARVRR